MKCPRCQHENPLGQKFCGECGARLAVACASCGASNPPGQKFCGECGTGLVPEAVAKPSGSRPKRDERTPVGRTAGPGPAPLVEEVRGGGIGHRRHAPAHQVLTRSNRPGRVDGIPQAAR